MSRLNEYFNKLGLTDTEIQIYLSLLKTGPSSVLNIAKVTNIKRATVHFNVENLIAKGFVFQTIQGARRLLVAETPARIENLIDERSLELNELKQQLPTVVDMLSRTVKEDISQLNMDIRIYEGFKEVSQVYTDVLTSSEIRSYVNTAEILKFFPDNMKIFSEAHHRNKSMKMWEILNFAEETDRYIQNMDPERYFYRYFPDSIDLSTIDYMVYDGKVTIINISYKPTAVVIKNSFYYQNAKSIFDTLWQYISLLSGLNPNQPTPNK